MARVQTRSCPRFPQIVVDRLGHTDNLQSLLKKFVADFLRPIASDGNNGVYAELFRIGNYLLGDIAHHFFAVLDLFVVKRITTVGGAKDRSSARQYATDFFQREFERFFRPDEAVEAIGDADDLPSIFQDGSFGGGANHVVQAGRVTASSSDTNAANVGHRNWPEILQDGSNGKTAITIIKYIALNGNLRVAVDGRN